MSAPLAARRRAFADAIGRMLADQVWRELTSGNSAAKNAKPRLADEAGRGIAGVDRRDRTRERIEAHP